ncbi:unnamed protein product [Aureobasidium mustum]|uniref:Uncharacterized protein n=1 Tax=Aureobasidium mustum TaxID=2773714 RepID=A0A9N8PLM8_9PEZI|nr:unnamed protein product [Aureobasidium mustum]
MTSVDADLHASFESHRSRVLQLKRNCLVKLFERVEVSPDSTDREELEDVWYEPWPHSLAGDMPLSITSSQDFDSLIHDGTKAPRSEEERLQAFTKIEVWLQNRAAQHSKPGPLTLPDDFKQLCALTDLIEGPGLPLTCSDIPQAFGGLAVPLISLGLNAERSNYTKRATGVDLLEYEATVILTMGQVDAPIAGGTWLCWLRDDTDTWKWTWVSRLGTVEPPHIFEDVRELLDGYCKTYLNVLLRAYEDIGEDEML